MLAGSATTFVHALCAGCDGAILALAALVPDSCVELVALVRDRRLDEARALQRRLLPIAKSVGGTYGVPGLKAALHLLGFSGGPPRPPLRPAAPSVIDIVRDQLDALGVLPLAPAGHPVLR